jgi:phosphatidylglycerophosphate synthase
MTAGVGQIVIRHDPSGEFMLAGVPLLARLILTALNGAAASTLRPLVAVAGEVSPDYRQRVAAVVDQVAQGLGIDWRGASQPWPAAQAPGRVLVIEASGLFTPDLVDQLATLAGPGSAFAALAEEGGAGGFWLLTKEGYDALAKGEPGVMRRMAATPENFCPVHDRASLQQAEKWLFKRFGKSTDGFVSRYLNRPLSTWVSRRLVRTSVTPNYLTLLTAASAFLMFVVLVRGTLMSVAMGCLLYHVTSIVDGFDGEVARAKFLSSRRGASFDTGVDMATNILFIIGLTLGLAKIYGPNYLILGGLVAVVALAGIALMTFVVWKGPKGGSFDVLQLTIRRRLNEWPIVSRLFEVLNTIMKRDFFALMFALLGLAGVAFVIPWLLAAGMIAWLFAIIMAAPLVIGADPNHILPDHIGPLAATKNSPASERPGE